METFEVIADTFIGFSLTLLSGIMIFSGAPLNLLGWIVFLPLLMGSVTRFILSTSKLITQITSFDSRMVKQSETK